MKQFILFIAILLFITGAGFALADAPPCPANQICLPNPLCIGGPGSPNCINSANDLIAQVSNYIMDVIGAVAVIMFVVAGIYWVISAGRPEYANRAKQIAIYAAVGVAIAAAGKGLIMVIQAVINPPTGG